MAAKIQIKRASSATANTAPSGNLSAGELAVSYGNAPAHDNGGGRLFVGNSDGSSNIVVGGQYFTALLDHTPGALTASSSLITDSNSKLAQLKVDDLDINGSTISTLAGNTNISVTPHGSGKVIIDGLSHPTADGTNGQFLKTDGSGNLSFASVVSQFTLAADSGTNSTFDTGDTLTFTGTDPIDTEVSGDSITISIDTASTSAKGAASFASADFAVSGAGQVTIHSVSNAQLAGSIANAKLANSSITIGSDAVALGGSRTDLNGLTSVDIDNITIDGNVISTTNSNGNLELTPNGTGTVTVPSGYKDRSGFGTNSLATKQYVDAIKTGLDVKDSVRAASTANITNISDALNSGDSIDGVTLANDDRVLLKDQTTGSENGIYVVGSSPARASDFDENAEVTGGTFVFVEEGTANADNGYVVTTDGTITVGSTAIAFTQFSGAGQIDPGNGLVKGTGASANTINAVGTANRITVSADAINIATNYVGQNTITTLGTITTGTWNGSTIAPTKGGTGLTTAAKGSVLVANTGDVFSALDGGGSTDKILFYNEGSDTITWESSLDAGTF
jgi:hypothetical protein